MQIKQIKGLPIGTEVVVSSKYIGHHVRPQEKTPETITERNCSVGKLVSYDTYRESHYKSDTATHHDWVISTDESVKRFLIQFDTLQKPVFAIIPSKDIICTKTEAEPRWAQQRLAKAKEQETKNAIDKAIADIEEKRKASDIALKTAVRANLIDLFGANFEGKGIKEGWNIRTTSKTIEKDGQFIGVLENTGTVEIPVDHFLRMVERFANQ